MTDGLDPMQLVGSGGSNDRIQLGGGLLQVSAAGGLTWTPTAGQTFTVASGGLTVSAGGVTVTGNSTITGTLGGLTGLTVASGGATITAGGLTVSAGGITVTGNSTITGTLGGVTTLTATTLAGTLSTAAQPNVTSLGTLTGLTVGGAVTITSTSANALAVGPSGTTNPAFNVDASTASAATGLTVKAAAAGAGLAVSVISSGVAENLTLDAKGTGTIGIGTVSTGAITLGHATTVTTGGLTVSAGGITVTGNSTITGTLGGVTGLTVASGGATITAGGLTVTAGGATITAGNLGVGTAPQSNIGVDVTGTITSGTAQYGFVINPTFSSSATVRVVSAYYALATASGSYTVPSAYGAWFVSPFIGASSAVTSMYGIYVQNQGAAGITNAYGIYLDATSGAATTNISFYNAGTTQLASGVGIGAAPTGSGVNVGAASGNNAIWNASQGAATATLYIGNASINVTSDVRLKRDIVPTSYDALALIGRLRPVDYTWADPSDTAEVNRNSRGRWTGLLAQDVIDVVPWVVNAPDRTCLTCRAGLACERHEAYWHIEYDQFAGLFVRAFQQMAEKINTLEARLQAAGIN